MKRIIALEIAITLLFTLVGCSNFTTNTEAEITEAQAKTTEEELVEQYQSGEWDGSTIRVYTYSDPEDANSDLIKSEYIVTDGMMYKDGEANGIIPDVGYNTNINGTLVGVAPADKSVIINANGVIYFFRKGCQINRIDIDPEFTEHYDVFVDGSTLMVKYGTRIIGYDYTHDNSVVIERNDVEKIINGISGLIISTLDHINMNIDIAINGNTASFSLGGENHTEDNTITDNPSE